MRSFTLMVGLTVAAAGISLSPAGAATSIPVPEKDPFYSVPSTIGADHDGEVLAVRAITAKSLQLSLPVKAWQLKYRTEDFRGRPTATVTTLLVPTSAWPGPGHRPLVSYQTAEDGVAGRCAPSYALRAGLRGGFTGSYSETPLIDLALAKGWAVAAPDYEGPRSEFLVAGTEARGVLDGIRAVRHFGPADLSHAPIGIWGYSGGAFASMAAAQLQPTYAPHLRLTGLAVGGLLANVRSTINAFSGSIAGGAIPMGINGFLRAYPKLHLMSYLNHEGRALVRKMSASCIFDAVPQRPFLRLSDIEARPDALGAKPVARMLRRNSPLYRRGVPRVPMYEYHTRGDEFAPIAPVRAILRRFCRAGVVVDHLETPLGEHLSEIVAGAPGAVQYLAQRFAGMKPTDSCGSARLHLN